MGYTQDGKLISIETPLGKDVLLLESLSGTEGLSQLFHLHLQLLSENASISPDKIVGQRVTISIQLDDEKKKRYINGFVSRFSQGGQDHRFTHYEAEVVPWVWFLTRIANCRIFQTKKIPDIIHDIFKEQGGDVKFKLQGHYDTRDYCVQYRETDFNFVSRLMEQYGIYYYFEHTKDKHTLVLGDAPSDHEPCPEQKKASYDDTSTSLEHNDVVTAWSQTQELRTGKFALTDYNFETPNTDLGVNVPSKVKVGGNAGFEVFDYPGDYEKKDQGDHLVKLRVEEEEATHLLVEGASVCRGFIAGYRFELADHYCKSFNSEYVLTEVHHSATVGSSYETGQGAREHYSNHFECIPKSFPFRPARVTPRPVVQGPQTAVVVGPSGEEIHTDKYGRVKVQFFWDREGKHNEKSSCWIRVSHPWGGKNWGSIWIPRIKQEVIVEFLEGDPDRPIITGRVYNADQTVPYKLPDNQTVSTFKSNSSKGGSGYNELRFEDKKGKEQIYLHAERDMDQRVKEKSREHIGKDRHLIVEGDQKEKVTGNKSLEVKQNQKEKVGMNLHVKVGINHEEKAGANYALDAGAIIHLKAGANCVIEAPAGITLKAGSSFITLLPALIAIQGTMVLINSGGAALPGPGASPEAPDAPDEADDGPSFDKK